ncbi:6836_t:CDS:2 [Diversispora eburnea]|uniref:6836_t:CDS:1 n=1 Tax=Diversispora eburnea TaxID=1213867 RepID=A0A9N9A989_9GLOM|nr:6836_t:CDS:2 [Diversispora eburnea]
MSSYSNDIFGGFHNSYNSFLFSLPLSHSPPILPHYSSTSESPFPPSNFNGSNRIFHYRSIIPYRHVKRRRRLTEEETNILINTFEKVQKPDSELRSQLATQLNMSSRAIQVWFQNRRAKVKRDTLESKNASKMNKPKKLTLSTDYYREKKSVDSNNSNNSTNNSATTSFLPSSSINNKTKVVNSQRTQNEQAEQDDYWNISTWNDNRATFAAFFDQRIMGINIEEIPIGPDNIPTTDFICIPDDRCDRSHEMENQPPLSRKNALAIGLGLGGGVVLIILVFMGVIFFKRRKKEPILEIPSSEI